MAGGKETPRQRMIGMMYLVLTALLALQIKDSVLEKFVLIEGGLSDSNTALFDYNDSVLESIQTDVANQGNKTGDQAVQKTAENVRQYTNELIAYIDNLKLEIGNASTGGDTAKLRRRSTLKKYEEPSRYLVNQGFAEKLKEQLDAYPEQVNSGVSFLGRGAMSPKWMNSIAKDANDFDLYKNNQEEKKKDYAHFNFYKAPLASVLAQLTFYKNQIYSKESEALNKLKTMVGTAVDVDPSDVKALGNLPAVASAPATSSSQESNDTGSSNPATSTSRPTQTGGTQSTEIKADEFLDGRFAGIDYAQATVLSESNLVTAGLDFNAQALLTLGNSSLQPEVKVNGQPVDVVNGRGVINFKATASEGEYDAAGLAQKSVEVEITADDGTGNKITRTTTHEYTVARPVIDVRSQSVDVLYLNCDNSLFLNVPALGPAYQPSFKVTGGTFTQGSQKGQISVDPTQREIKIDVSSSGLYIGSRQFEARNVPLPVLDVRPNGNIYNPNVGLDEMPTRLDLRLTVDEGFSERYPNDAAFFVSKGEIILSRGKSRKGVIRIESLTPDVDLASLRSRMASGDRIVVSVEEITRVNYKQQQFPVAFTGSMTLAIN